MPKKNSFFHHNLLLAQTWEPRGKFTSCEGKKMAISATSVLTAAVLTVGTLGVFRSAQSLGPDAAVRQFIQGVRGGNYPEAQRRSLGDLNSPGGQVLVAMVRAIPGPYQVVQRESRGDLVLLVVGSERGGVPMYEAFLVRRVNGGWRIDVDGTASLRLRSMIPNENL